MSFTDKTPQNKQEQHDQEDADRHTRAQAELHHGVHSTRTSQLHTVENSSRLLAALMEHTAATLEDSACPVLLHELTSNKWVGSQLTHHNAVRHAATSHAVIYALKCETWCAEIRDDGCSRVSATVSLTCSFTQTHVCFKQRRLWT